MGSCECDGNPTYTYVIVRNDLSQAQKAVQACHASLQAGKEFGWPDDRPHPHLALLTVKTESELVELSRTVEGHNLDLSKFYEPDLNNSLTAIAISGISGQLRSIFKHLPTLKFTTEDQTMETHTITKSKWGYHPCTKEHYLKLKRLRHLHYQNIRATAKWKRWDAKLPHNRILWKRDGRIWVKAGMMPEPSIMSVPRNLYNNIYCDYIAAKYPSESTPKSLVLSVAEVDKLLAEAEKWWAERNKPVELLVSV